MNPFGEGEVAYNELASFPGEGGGRAILLVAPRYAQNPEFIICKPKADEDLATVSLNFHFFFTLIWQHSPVSIAQFRTN